jgi:glycine betaine/proline transport system substrate-binding protein
MRDAGPARRWIARALGLMGLGVAVLAMTYVVRMGDAGPIAPAGAGGVDTAPAGAATGGDDRPLRIGWTAWADAEVVSLLATRLIEGHLDVEVERVMADIGIQYRAVARGDLDLMLMAWLPLTHRSYWRQVRNEVVDLGPIYTGRLGWVVPEYVPADALGSIGDLGVDTVATRVGGRIQGIDPGSGLMQASERAIRAYRLDDVKLVPASGAAMTAVLDRAIRERRWVVVTAWRPHWIFARYGLRFLEDPEGILGRTEFIHALGRQGIGDDHPEVVEFLSRFYLPSEDLADLLLEARSSSAEEAVTAYLRNNPQRVAYWVSGEMPGTP